MSTPAMTTLLAKECYHCHTYCCSVGIHTTRVNESLAGILDSARPGNAWQQRRAKCAKIGRTVRKVILVAASSLNDHSSFCATQPKQPTMEAQRERSTVNKEAQRWSRERQANHEKAWDDYFTRQQQANPQWQRERAEAARLSVALPPPIFCIQRSQGLQRLTSEEGVLIFLIQMMTNQWKPSAAKSNGGKELFRSNDRLSVSVLDQALRKIHGLVSSVS